MADLQNACAFEAHPLTGSPAGRLRDETTRRLAAGRVPRCPHPDQPGFWYLPAGMVGCGTCTSEFIRVSGEADSVCDICGAPGTTVAGWVTGGVPCFARLCDACRTAGLVQTGPN